jgi:hypothetical protein
MYRHTVYLLPKVWNNCQIHWNKYYFLRKKMLVPSSQYISMSSHLVCVCVILDIVHVVYSELEKLRQQVVTEIRSNQQLENDLNLMDIKIGLLVKNRITLQVSDPYRVYSYHQVLQWHSGRVFDHKHQILGYFYHHRSELAQVNNSSLPPSPPPATFMFLTFLQNIFFTFINRT